VLSPKHPPVKSAWKSKFPVVCFSQCAGLSDFHHVHNIYHPATEGYREKVLVADPSSSIDHVLARGQRKKRGRVLVGGRVRGGWGLGVLCIVHTPWPTKNSSHCSSFPGSQVIELHVQCKVCASSGWELHSHPLPQMRREKVGRNHSRESS